MLVNKGLFFVSISFLFLYNCDTIKTKDETSSLIEISFQKAFVWYSEDIAFDWSPRRIYVESKIISHSNDTTLLLVADERFHEPFIKSRIATIVNQDTILLSPGLWSHDFAQIKIMPRDTIQHTFSYVLDDYIRKALKGTDKDKSISKEKTKKFDEQLIIDLFDAPLFHLLDEADYKYKKYNWDENSNLIIPKVTFTKSTPFKIFIEDHTTLRCEDCH